MRIPESIRNKFHTAGLFFVVACCLFIPLSSSIMGGTAILACLCWIISGRAFSLPRLMFSNIHLLLAVTLFILLSAGVYYSPADLSTSLSTLKKYRELLFFAMTATLFMGNARIAKLAENSFITGCIVLLALSYSMFYSIIPMEKWGYSTVYHITHSFFMAILAFWSLQRAFDSRQFRYLWLLLFGGVSFNLFYIAPGRTGMLVYAALILLTLFQRLPLKKSLGATAVACLLVVVTFNTSTNFSSRVKDAVDEIQTYQAKSSRSSLGMRFDWWQNSVDLIRQKPIFGHGTGSFKVAQSELVRNTKTKITDNPHNEYLLLGVQTGLVGL
ncbi:MAG: O-antigen ligase family protein, partial [Desulforhopalus sp.]